MFLAEVFPKLVAHHSWLYRERDLHETGLVTLIHPWECGLDSTPPWMRALHDMRLPRWLRTAERLHLARLLRSAPHDTRYLPAAERASDDDGLRMLAVAVHAKRYDFRLRDMPRDRSVLIDDLRVQRDARGGEPVARDDRGGAGRNRRPVPRAQLPTHRSRAR